MRGEPLPELRAVDAGVVEVLHALAQGADALGDALPLDRQAVVGPVQIALGVEEGEQELAAEAVVVADPAAGDREAEQAVEEDRVLHVAGEGEASRSSFTASPNAVRSQRSSSSEYIQ